MASHHGTAALLLVASLLVAVTLADARVAVHRSEFGGYVVADTTVPALSCSEVHGVRVGETCDSVAQAAGLTEGQFLGFNPNINCARVFVGQWVCLAATSS